MNTFLPRPCLADLVAQWVGQQEELMLIQEEREQMEQRMNTLEELNVMNVEILQRTASELEDVKRFIDTNNTCAADSSWTTIKSDQVKTNIMNELLTMQTKLETLLDTTERHRVNNAETITQLQLKMEIGDQGEQTRRDKLATLEANLVFHKTDQPTEMWPFDETQCRDYIHYDEMLVILRCMTDLASCYPASSFDYQYEFHGILRDIMDIKQKAKAHTDVTFVLQDIRISSHNSSSSSSSNSNTRITEYVLACYQGHGSRHQLPYHLTIHVC